jgi:signal transduction histidine kinase
MRDALLLLRPMALDRHGLEHALRAGPLRELLVEAEIEFELLARGTLAVLDRDAQDAIYRICQEAAIDCVRHRRTARFEIGLRVLDVAPGRQTVELELVYHRAARAAGVGVDFELTVEGESAVLPRTRDRLLALGGECRRIVEDEVVRYRIRFTARGAAEAAPA